MKFADYLPSPAAWRRLAPALLLAAAVLLLFRDTAVAMVTIWDRSDTFAHAFLVPPIVAWLIWRRGDTLATIPARPALWVLLPMAAAGALWLLGELAGVNAATQLALVAMLVLIVPLVYGWRLARALTFPLLFLFFAVPVGEFMVPYMMAWTADFAAMAVRLSGIPIYREGQQFVIPSGTWSVVEACSGVRYLIASFMVGTLFAYLNFQSNWRRAVFMVASLAMPILANWVRAYLIVMIGHLSDNRLAAGVDHIIYGWVFFGLVIGVMFMIGARFAEPDAPVPAAAPANAVADPVPARGLSAWALGAAAVLLLVGVQTAIWRLDRPQTGPLPVLALPDKLGGWTAGGPAVATWVPAYANAAASAAANYSAGGDSVGLRVGYYRDQGYDRKLVTSTNNLVDAEEHGAWAQTESGGTAIDTPTGSLKLRTAALRGSAEPGSPSAQRLRVWHVYWIGGHYTTSDAVARLRLAVNRLMGQGDDAAVLFVYTPMKGAADAAAADAVLAGFVTRTLPALDALLAGARQRP
jgi:exosortase A